MNETFLTVEEVAEILRISANTLLKSWKDRIGYYRFTHRILFKRADVEAFIDFHFVPRCPEDLRLMRSKLLTLLHNRVRAIDV